MLLFRGEHDYPWLRTYDTSSVVMRLGSSRRRSSATSGDVTAAAWVRWSTEPPILLAPCRRSAAIVKSHLLRTPQGCRRWKKRKEISVDFGCRVLAPYEAHVSSFALAASPILILRPNKICFPFAKICFPFAILRFRFLFFPSSHLFLFLLNGSLLIM